MRRHEYFNLCSRISPIQVVTTRQHHSLALLILSHTFTLAAFFFIHPLFLLSWFSAHFEISYPGFVYFLFLILASFFFPHTLTHTQTQILTCAYIYMLQFYLFVLHNSWPSSFRSRRKHECWHPTKVRPYSTRSSSIFLACISDSPWLLWLFTSKSIRVWMKKNYVKKKSLKKIKKHE